MKQFMPLLLIAAMIGGAFWLFQDEYEPPFDPLYEDAAVNDDWRVVFFLEPEDDTLTIGAWLEWISEDRDAEDLEKLEFFVNHGTGSFFYQDLNVEEGGEELIYQERCDGCLSPSGRLEASMMINWQAGGETGSDFHHFVLPDIDVALYEDYIGE